MKQLLLANACVAAILMSGSLRAQEQPGPISDPASSSDWAISTIYTHSNLGDAQGGWDELDTWLYYRVNPKFVGTIRANSRRRNGDTDLIKELGVEFYPNAKWDFRASFGHVSEPDFTYERAAGLGATWHVSERVDILLDAKRYNFAEGNITETRPGFGFHLSPETRIGVTYIHGSAYGLQSYNGGVVRLDHTLANSGRISVSASNSVDPERAGSGALLFRSKSASLFYHFPVRQNMEFIVGAEREWREESYNRTGISAGLVVRF